uniref:SOCS box domain-containing protein n=2 Tax=Esox lucius TaxID=8010 RepID=A0A3P8ZCE4_ESOLU
MKTETDAENEFDQSEEDWDEDVAKQDMSEQSLLKYNNDPTGAEGDPDEMFTAIKEGNEEILTRLAKQPGAMSIVDDRGWIPLHEAAVQEFKSILEIVFSASPQGAEQCRTLKGETPLFLAVVCGLRDNATFLLQNGSCPDLQNDDLESPLVAAIVNDQYDCASLLLRYHAKVDQTGDLERTALHEASLLGLENFVHLLLQAGADPNAYDIDQMTPLALAAETGHLNVVEVLLQKGAKVQPKTEGSLLFEAVASGNPDITCQMLAYGADPNVPNHNEYLPIHCAAYHGHLLVLEQLISVTTMEAVKKSGMSPLHSAAAGGQTQCLEVLLDAGYDPNFMLHPRVRSKYDDDRRSALYFAVWNNDVQSTRLLLEAEAMVNQDPVNCLQVALRLGNYELINTLLRYGANANYYTRNSTTHFPPALQYVLKDEVMLRMLLNHGYDVQRCFECPYGDSSHDYAPWTTSLTKDMVFCEVITVKWLKNYSAQVVRIMLDYADHVTLCVKLKECLKTQKQWPDICHIQENVRSLQHLCRLRIRDNLKRLRLRSPVFISYLPLPPRLKDYLRYREYDVYSRGSPD